MPNKQINKYQSRVSCRDYLEEESEDEDKETREGPGFQAELPPQQLRPKPRGKGAEKGPPPDEAKWLTGRVLAPRQVGTHTDDTHGGLAASCHIGLRDAC